MKRALVAFGLAGYFAVALPASPAHTWRCPDLALEARGLLEKVQDPAKKQKLAALVEAGEKAHNEGNHDGSVQKLEAAIAELKK